MERMCEIPANVHEGMRRNLNDRDITRLELGGFSIPNDVAAPSNWDGNRSFLHFCFGHYVV